MGSDLFSFWFFRVRAPRLSFSIHAQQQSPSHYLPPTPLPIAAITIAPPAPRSTANPSLTHALYLAQVVPRLPLGLCAADREPYRVAHHAHADRHPQSRLRLHLQGEGCTFVCKILLVKIFFRSPGDTGAIALIPYYIIFQLQRIFKTIEQSIISV